MDVFFIVCMMGNNILNTSQMLGALATYIQCICKDLCLLRRKPSAHMLYAQCFCLFPLSNEHVEIWSM